MLVLSTRHAAVARATAKGITRFSMGAVQVKDDGDGRYTLSATDGRIAARVQGQNTATPTIVGAESLPNGGTIGMVQAKDFAAALKTTGRKPTEIALAMTAPTDPLTDGQAGRYTFATANGTTTGDLASGRFPDLDGVLPTTAPGMTVDLNPKLLAQLLDVVSGLGVERVTLELRTKTGCRGDDIPQPVILRGTNDHGETFTGIIVPLSEPRR